MVLLLLYHWQKVTTYLTTLTLTIAFASTIGTATTSNAAPPPTLSPKP